MFEMYTCTPVLAFNIHSWTQKSVEEYVQDYHERAASGGDFLISPGQRMCTHMFHPEAKEMGMTKVGI